MRRLIVFFCLAFLVMGMVHAAPVSRARALSVASNLYAARHVHGDRGATPAQATLLRWQGMPTIWAVNMAQGGFVLLSADDRAQPILGLADEGAFDPELRVPGFDFLMEEWHRQIHHIARNGIAATPEITRAWALWESGGDVRTAAAAPVPYLPVVVPPLMTTTWNQGCYYNANCPADAGGSCGRTWTGCGATAMAQCMKYHAWPNIGFGSDSYTHGLYGPQSANPGGTTYNWASMPNNVTAANPAVAQLMYHAGVTLTMNYGTTESTCFFSDLNDSFKQFFRYSLSTISRSKLAYTDAQWDVVLRTELDAARIVPYNGGAHIWVCDGYQTGPDLYHMNWGWGGTYNGYYAQNNLNPGSLTFSTVGCIVGLKPVSAFEVAGDSAVYGESGGVVNVEVAGDSNWVAAVSVPWATLSISSGTEGYFKPAVTATANPGYTQRTGHVAFQRGTRRDTVWLRQAGITPRLSVSPTPIAEGASGGTRSVTVNCDSNWVVTFADPWIGYAPAAGIGNGSITLTIASNGSAGSRTGTVVLTRGSLSRTVTVNQDGTSAFWCVPVLGVPAAVGATNVQLKTLNRTSGISEGYVLATDSTILKRDSSYTIRVSFSGSVAPAVWIDWNQDGDFFDTGEAIVAPSGSWYPSFGGTKTATVAVPSTATLGQTRLRVYVKTFSGGPTTGPCAATNVGDIEDFNVYVVPSSVLPVEELALSLDEDALTWTWGFPTAARSFTVARAEGQDWVDVAEVGGEMRRWEAVGGLPAGRYRLAALQQDGQVTYSNVVEQRLAAAQLWMRIGPNPVVGGSQFLLQYGGGDGPVALTVVDLQGRILRQDHLLAAGQAYVPTEGWARGTYLVQLRDRRQTRNVKLVVE